MSVSNESAPCPEPAAPALTDLLQRVELLESLVLIDQAESVESSEDNEDEELARSFGPLSLARAPLTTAQQLEQAIDACNLQHFKGSEFTPYWTRTRNGVKNSVPPQGLWPNIVQTLVILDRLRTELGSPIRLLSTYRSPAYNKAVGGAMHSQHEQFRAIDFTSSSGGPRNWADILKSYRGKSFKNPLTGDDFVFRGGIGIYQTSLFVHVDTRGYDANWTG